MRKEDGLMKRPAAMFLNQAAGPALEAALPTGLDRPPPQLNRYEFRTARKPGMPINIAGEYGTF
jgi:hypothetical protein